MKKTAILFALIFTAACSFAAAEEQQDAQQPDAQRSEMPQDGPGMMGGGRMGMKGGPMMSIHPTLVATSDGGVVVLMGKKLVKYDRDLELVKEVELKGGLMPMSKRPEQMPDESSSGSESKSNNAETPQN